MGWVLDREELQVIADALNRVTGYEGSPGRVFVSPDGNQLEYRVEFERGLGVVQITVAEKGEHVELFLPSKVALSMRKDDLIDPGRPIWDNLSLPASQSGQADAEGPAGGQG